MMANAAFSGVHSSPPRSNMLFAIPLLVPANTHTKHKWRHPTLTLVPWPEPGDVAVVKRFADDDTKWIVQKKKKKKKKNGRDLLFILSFYSFIVISAIVWRDQIIGPLFSIWAAPYCPSDHCSGVIGSQELHPSATSVIILHFISIISLTS